MRSRQRTLGVPETFEWIVELAPEVGPAAGDGGLSVAEHPLMHLPDGAFRSAPAPPGMTIERAEDADGLAIASAIAMLGFTVAGTAVTEIGLDALDEAIQRVGPAAIGHAGWRVAQGLTVTVIARIDGAPVAVGSHNPVGSATEIVGVATLPAFRRRGLAAAVTSFLVEDALRLGCLTLLLSANDDDVARIYGRLGFEVVGRAGAAEPRD